MEFAAIPYDSLFTPTTPIVEPITVQNVKDWSVIDFADLDGKIPFWISATRSAFEIWCSVKLINGAASFKVKISKEGHVVRFPFALSMSNVGNVVINEISDGADDEPLVIDEDYYLDESLRFSNYGTYRIDFDLAYDSIPDDLKMAMLTFIDYKYHKTGSQDLQLGIPEDVKAIISSHRQIWV